ncbi:hypothetical protein CALCODRAFT_485871 [Calocera cornea HHB12733]|uniref:Uncharacterized protein n=1 Tax=Calocera cornea HHB12733 TaxID=1353952 RepID=A0A165E3N0_9BASI|nr:hypothetical protein CALCODRAFT_485871 [Calocera cornea HHB12733]
MPAQSTSRRRRAAPPVTVHVLPQPQHPVQVHVAYTPPRPGQRPLVLPQKILQKPPKAFTPPVPWSPSSSSPSSPPLSSPRTSLEYAVPPLSAYSDHPFSPSSSRSSSPPGTPNSGRSTPTFTPSSPSSFSPRDSASESSVGLPYSPSGYLAFVQHESPSRRLRARPTGEYITPPEQPLLRPTTFWKNAYRTALGRPSDAPASQLVRSASFIVAGHELPELITDDLAFLCYHPRRREGQDTDVRLLPEGRAVY